MALHFSKNQSSDSQAQTNNNPSNSQSNAATMDQPTRQNDMQANGASNNNVASHNTGSNDGRLTGYDQQGRPMVQNNVVERIEPVSARGGVSLWAIITGVVISLGAFALVGAIVTAILGAIGLNTLSVHAFSKMSPHSLASAGIAAGVVAVIIAFLSYFWGGYTAGRLARGAGALNGLLVSLIVVVLFTIGAGVLASSGLPGISLTSLVPKGSAANIGTWIGVAILVAMFLGSILGGVRGVNWHSRLERRYLDLRSSNPQMTKV